MNHITNLERAIASQHNAAVHKNPLAAILEAGERASGADVFFDAAGDVRAVHEKTPASADWIKLQDLEIPAQSLNRGMTAMQPQGSAAGKTSTFAEAVYLNSRALQAGLQGFVLSNEHAQLRPLSIAPQQTEMPAVMARRRTQFGVVAPAQMNFVLEGTDAPLSDVPLFVSSIDGDLAKQFACRFKVSRRGLQNGDITRDDLIHAAFVSLAQGIGRAIDRVVMDALHESGIGAFSLGAVAAAGLDFRELKALTNSAATGATVDALGQLRVAGVPAVMTDSAIASSIVGKWTSAAVVLSDDAYVIASRANKAGEMNISCWIGMQPLMPIKHFWTVAA